MKKYSSHKTHKGKTAYRTPSRLLVTLPEKAKREKTVLKAGFLGIQKNKKINWS